MNFKKSQFNEWYVEVIEAGKLVDKRYPVKGMNIWLPYGWSLMLNIDNYFRQVFNMYKFTEINFPLLIPKDQFDKEEEHIKGFSKQVFYVNSAGDEQLDVPLVLRPTSETAMYPMFSLWIRTHADLPLKLYQIVNVFRYETKQTRTFLRVREIHFFEAHTAHTTFEKAELQIQENLKIWKTIATHLALPYVINKRPDWDKFPGAYYSLAADIFMPNGRSLQIGTIHQYKQNFAIPYNIKYTNKHGEQKFVHQTTFGISERIVGAIVSVHGDDHGLIIPPTIAPIQIIIIPIISEKKELVLTEAKALYEQLKLQFRVEIDLREEYTPGYKFYDWELKGVPLRIEIGPIDINANQVVVVRRDTFEKVPVMRNALQHKLRDFLEQVQSNMYLRAKTNMEKMIIETQELDKIRDPSRIYKVFWCGRDLCAAKLEEYADKSVLGIPVEEKQKIGKCIICGADTRLEVYLSKSY